MALAKFERRLLLQCWKHHTQGSPSFEKCVRPSNLLVLALVAVGFAVQAYFKGQIEWFFFGVGFAVGGLVMTLTYAWAAHQQWPFLDQIIDWPKVHAILEEDRGAA